MVGKFQNFVSRLSIFIKRLNIWIRTEPEDEDHDHEGGRHHQGHDRQVEGQGVILQPGLQVHPEHGREAGPERQAEHAHLNEKAHPDDPIFRNKTG
jgi:hypothetical protein